MELVEPSRCLQRLKRKELPPESQGSAGVYFDDFQACFSSAYVPELSELLGITPVAIMR